MEEYIEFFLASVTGAGLGGSIITLIVNRKLQHHHDRLLEKLKTKNTLVEIRFDNAVLGLNSLSIMNQDLAEDLKKFEIPNSVSPIGKILQDFHPRYRAKFRAITSQLEIANDLLSVYRLLCDDLLHPSSLKELLGGVRRNTSDCKQAYRSIWQMVFDSLNAVLRVAAQFPEFWAPESNYREIAGKWVEVEKKRFKAHFSQQFQEPSNKSIFTLRIEHLNNFDEFWKGPGVSAKNLRQREGPRGRNGGKDQDQDGRQ